MKPEDKYESDERANNSADEKHISKAKDKAICKKFQMAKSVLGLALLVVVYGMFRPTLRINFFSRFVKIYPVFLCEFHVVRYNFLYCLCVVI